VTRLATDVNGFKLFPDGKHLVVALDVWPDAKSIAESAKRDDERAKSKVKARVYDQLLFRHWDHWEDGKYSHLFVWTAPDEGGKADDAHDLMSGVAADAPVQPFGGMDDVAVSPEAARWPTSRGSPAARTRGAPTPTCSWSPPTGEQAGRCHHRERGVRLRPGVRPTASGSAADDEAAGLERPIASAAVIVAQAARGHRGLTAGRRGGVEPRRPGRSTPGTDNVGNHSVFAIDVASGNAKLGR
jgi:hypothetical protein